LIIFIIYFSFTPLAMPCHASACCRCRHYADAAAAITPCHFLSFRRHEMLRRYLRQAFIFALLIIFAAFVFADFR